MTSSLRLLLNGHRRTYLQSLYGVKTNTNFCFCCPARGGSHCRSRRVFKVPASLHRAHANEFGNGAERTIDARDKCRCVHAARGLGVCAELLTRGAVATRRRGVPAHSPKHHKRTAIPICECKRQRLRLRDHNFLLPPFSHRRPVWTDALDALTAQPIESC